MGPWRPAKDRSRDVLAFCVQYHQNRPNINEMAAFQSLAIHLLKNDGNGFNTKGSVAWTLCHWTTNTKYVHTHTQRHTQIQSYTPSLTHLHTLPPTLSLTHSRTSTLFLLMKQGAFGPMEACKRQISRRTCILHLVSSKSAKY